MGAAKSGTTSLFHYLRESPQIFFPDRKELNFWYTGGDEKWAIMKRWPDLPRTISEYAGHFQQAKPGQLLGEASPGYMVFPKETIANLKKYHPNWREVKIVIILREPVSKIWSHYCMVKRAGMDPENLDLKTALLREKDRVGDPSLLLDVLYLFNTSYYDQVKPFLEAFNDVKVVLFDDLNKNPQVMINDLCVFLGIEKFTPSNLGTKLNAAPANKQPFVIKTKWLRLLSKGVPAGLKIILKRFISNFKIKKSEIPKDCKRIIEKSLKDDLVLLNKIIEPDIRHWFKSYK